MHCYSRIVNRANGCVTIREFCARKCKEDIAPDYGKRTSSTRGGCIAPDTGRRCNFVYECLSELLEDALEDNNNHCCCKRC